MTHTEPDRLIGEVLDGRFRLDRLLGEGGMGRVYVATQLSVERQVAVKVMLEGAAQMQTFRDRFFREAKVVATFTHPSIVRLIDFGQDPRLQVLYLVMDYIEGIPLSGLIAQGRVHWEYALRVAAHIAQGLADAHARGIVHRDLKPDNVMLSISPDGVVQPLILDFGVALPQQEGATKLTAAGTICGTPAYMAPEQARSQEVGPTADLYALGGVLFELLSGRLPFESETAMAMMLDKLHGPAPPLASTLPPDTVPPQVANFVDALLQKDPAMRPQSARIVVDDITRLLGTGDFKLRADAQPRQFSRWFATAHRHGVAPATPTFPEPRYTHSPDAPTDIRVSPEAPTQALQPPPVASNAATLVTVVLGLVVGIVAVGAVLFLAPGDDDDRHGPPDAPPAVVLPDPPPEEPPAAVVERDVGNPGATETTDAATVDAGPRDGCGAELADRGLLVWRADLGGRRASYAVYVPKRYDPAKPHRTLLLLHKGNRNGRHAIELRGFTEIADREDLVIVAPDAPSGSWVTSDHAAVVGTLEAAAARLCLDPRWLYGVGIGSGEEMLEHIAEVGPPLSAMAGDGYRPSQGWVPNRPSPVPFLHTWGKRSPFAPREGGFSGCNAKQLIPLHEKIEFWREIGGCWGKQTRYRNTPHAECYTWNCKNAPFVVCEVDSAREWIDEAPDANLNPFCKYDPTTKFPHAEEMWRFLSKEGRPLGDPEAPPPKP